MIDFVGASLSSDLVTRVRAEFREMPGMCVTTAQAARLWQLSQAGAESLLCELVHAGFLLRLNREHYRLPLERRVDDAGAGP